MQLIALLWICPLYYLRLERQRASSEDLSSLHREPVCSGAGIGDTLGAVKDGKRLLSFLIHHGVLYFGPISL